MAYWLQNFFSVLSNFYASTLTFSLIKYYPPSALLKFCELGFDCSFLLAYQVLVEGYQSQGSVGFASLLSQQKCCCNYSCSALVLLTPCPCLKLSPSKKTCKSEAKILGSLSECWYQLLGRTDLLLPGTPPMLFTTTPTVCLGCCI